MGADARTGFDGGHEAYFVKAVGGAHSLDFDRWQDLESPTAKSRSRCRARAVKAGRSSRPPGGLGLDRPDHDGMLDWSGCGRVP
jgi:hypothetical protein